MKLLPLLLPTDFLKSSDEQKYLRGKLRFDEFDDSFVKNKDKVSLFLTDSETR